MFASIGQWRKAFHTHVLVAATGLLGSNIAFGILSFLHVRNAVSLYQLTPQRCVTFMTELLRLSPAD